jgi:hypothetical protein
LARTRLATSEGAFNEQLRHSSRHHRDRAGDGRTAPRHPCRAGTGLRGIRHCRPGRPLPGAQFFAAGLVSLTGSPNAPAWYIFAAILLALLGLRLAPETAGKDLD